MRRSVLTRRARIDVSDVSGMSCGTELMRLWNEARDEIAPGKKNKPKSVDGNSLGSESFITTSGLEI